MPIKIPAAFRALALRFHVDTHLVHKTMESASVSAAQQIGPEQTNEARAFIERVLSDNTVSLMELWNTSSSDLLVRTEGDARATLELILRALPR